MAKINIKSEKITPFGGIFQVRELFSVRLSIPYRTFISAAEIALRT